MITYLIALIYTIAFVYYAKYQFIDGRKGLWHFYGLVMRLSFWAAMLTRHQWQDVLLASAICLWIYEVGINVIALKQKPLYCGTTSTMDIHFGKKKWLYMACVVIVTVVIKLFINN